MQILKAKWDGAEVSITYTKPRGNGADELTIVSADRPASEFRQAWGNVSRQLADLFELSGMAALVTARQVGFAYTDTDDLKEAAIRGDIMGAAMDRRIAVKVRFVGDEHWRGAELPDALWDLISECTDYVEGVREQQKLPGMDAEQARSVSEFVPKAVAAVQRLKDNLDEHGVTMEMSIPDDTDLAGTSEDGSVIEDESEPGKDIPTPTEIPERESTAMPAAVLPSKYFFHPQHGRCRVLHATVSKAFFQPVNEDDVEAGPVYECSHERIRVLLQDEPVAAVA